jgi:hypothetical protein
MAAANFVQNGTFPMNAERENAPINTNDFAASTNTRNTAMSHLGFHAFCDGQKE